MPSVVREPERGLGAYYFALERPSGDGCQYCALGWLMKELLGADDEEILTQDSYDEGLPLKLQEFLSVGWEVLSEIGKLNDAAEREDRVKLLKEYVDNHPDLIWEARA